MPAKLTVADVMTKDVTTVFEENNLLQVFSLLGPYRFRHLPVVDGKSLVGILSQRDLLQVTTDTLRKTQAASSRVLEETFVRDVMATNVVTVRPEASLATAVQLLLDHHVGSLPVVDERNQLVGIVTDHDLLRSLHDSL